MRELLKKYGPALSGALWNAVESFYYPLLLLVSTPILLRQLGAGQYGALLFATAVAGLGGISNLGTGNVIVKYVSEYAGRDSATAVTVVRVSFAVTLAGCLLFSLGIAAFVLSAPKALAGMGPGQDPVLFAAAIVTLVFVQQADGVFGATLKGLGRFDRSAKIDAVFKTAGVAAVIAAAVAGAPVATLVFAQALGLLCGGMAKAWAASQLLSERVIKPVLDPVWTRRVLSMGGWSWLMGLSVVAFNSVDRLIVGSMLGAETLARYGVCMQLAQLSHAVPAALMFFVFPHVSRRAGTDAGYAVAGVRTRSIALNFAIACPIALLLWFFGEDVLRLWIGSAFAGENARYLRILVGAHFLLALNVAPYYILLGVGEMRYVALTTIFGGTGMLVAMLILIPLYALTGAVISRVFFGMGVSLNFFRVFKRA